MKKITGLVFGVICISGLIPANSTGFGYSVMFSLSAPTYSINELDSAAVSFSLVGAIAKPSIAAGPGGAGLIEDSDWPYNTAIGWYALGSNSTGMLNVAVGYHALFSNTTGSSNMGVGRSALYSNTSGSSNVAIGGSALYSNTIGSYNLAVGRNTLYSNTIGEFNEAAGYEALYSNTIGNCNLAVGRNALYSNTSGSYNVAVGRFALNHNASGQNNIAIGEFAGNNIEEGSWNIAIGNHIQPEQDESHTIRIGRAYYDSDPNFPPTGQNKTFIAGIIESQLSSTDEPFIVGITSEGRLGTMSRDLLPQGPQGPPGPPGEGLIPGSLLFLLPGATVPAGYSFIGSTSFSLTVMDSTKHQKLTVNVYLKQ